MPLFEQDMSGSVEDDPGARQILMPSVLSALAFFFIMASYYIMRPVRDQLSGAVGSTTLPLFYFTTFCVMLLLTPVFGASVARFPRRQLLGWVYGFFILSLCAFVPAFLMQDRIGARMLGTVFFVWVSVFNLFVVSLFWSFMADIFSSESARRVFPLIALSGMGGAVFGPAITRLLVHALGVAPLLVVSAAMLGAALTLLLRLSAQHGHLAGSASSEAIGGSLWAGIKELWSRPFLRYMAILMLLGDGIGTLAYALVADYVKAHFSDITARTAFYADIDLAANLIGAVLQLSLTRWLLIWRGASWGLLVPAIVNTVLLSVMVIFGSSHVVTMGFTASWMVLMLSITRGFAYGMTKPATDALYTRVPRETRYKGKNFVETTIWRFGDFAVISGISGLGKLGVSVAGMAAVGVAASATAAWVAKLAGSSPDLLPEDLPETSAGALPGGR